MKHTPLTAWGLIQLAKPAMLPTHHQVSPSALSPPRIHPLTVNGEEETESGKAHGHIHKPERMRAQTSRRVSLQLCPCGLAVLLPASVRVSVWDQGQLGVDIHSITRTLQTGT